MRIQFEDLHFTYPSGDRALQGITIEISGTDRVALIGQNGSGKTTFAKHFNGILRPTSGKVLIDGQDINTRTTAEWAAQIGYVFQNPQDQLFLETVKKELEFGPKKIKMEPERIAQNVSYAAELCRVDDMLDVHPFDLSATQRRFCAIASIIAMDPQVILLDEPTGGQDYRGTLLLEQIVWDLQQKGKLVITISHDMDFVIRNFERVIVLCDGKVLIADDTRTAFSEVEKLATTYIEPPPITRIGQALAFEETVRDLQEFFVSFDAKLRARSAVSGKPQHTKPCEA
jgi:energy-coupling factor transport system ATP-binding protein